MLVTLLCVPERWAAVILMSKDAVMNHKHLSRYIIMLSLDDPLWLRPGFGDHISLCASNGAQMAQVTMMGTSALAIISIGVYLVVKSY